MQTIATHYNRTFPPKFDVLILFRGSWCLYEGNCSKTEAECLRGYIEMHGDEAKVVDHKRGP